MPEMNEFPPGLPSWADLASPSLDESVSFYRELFGWEAQESENAEETGGYQTFLKDGKRVAGVAPIQNEGTPPSWNTYIAVSDADEIAGKVKEAGGEVIAEPMDVMDLGRMAFFADPTGAAFGVWQAKEHKGADLVSEPGAPAWHQVNTRDPEKAQEFYEAVFGWDNERVDTGGADYWEWNLDGTPVGGMFRMGEDFPDDVPPHWIVFFAVEDTDQATEAAKEKGAQVRAEPVDTEAGRFSVMTDPHGAAFAVITQPDRGEAGGDSDETEDRDQGKEDGGEDEEPRAERDQGEDGEGEEGDEEDR